MASRKKAKPNRSESSLLLTMLAVAIIIGVALGTYLGRTSLPDRSTQPSSSNPGAKTASPKPVPHINRPIAAKPMQHQPKRQHKSTNVEASETEPHRVRQVSHEIARSDKNKQFQRARILATVKEIARVDSPNLVALTFDAGASSAPTFDILDALKAAGLHVTFFLTGKWCERNESIVRRIADEGHEIANHTYSHRDLRKLGNEAIVEELTRVDEIVQRITGQRCAPYFRPPFGARDRRVIEVAGEAGYRCVYWSVDSWDAFKKDITAEEIRSRVLHEVQPGDIVLMHCGSWATAQALPQVIRDLESRGLKIVSVSQLIGAK
jgi:peptidoglycan/xylan/chitin deacetylase (PgdA/CDA1 family)